MQAVWGVVSRGLAYIDFSQPAPENWTLELTERGQTALDEGQYIPDNVPAYLRKIAADVPDLSQTANLYLQEALGSYSAGNYLAATMMIGVAAEAIFYEAAEAFAAWTPDGSGKNLADLLNKPEKAYIQKFVEFRKRIPPLQNHFPSDLQQNLDLNLNSILELLRLARNNVGHPTGIQMNRENAFQHIVLFPMLAKRLYDIRNFCQKPTAASSSSRP